MASIRRHLNTSVGGKTPQASTSAPDGPPARISHPALELTQPTTASLHGPFSLFKPASYSVVPTRFFEIVTLPPRVTLSGRRLSAQTS